VHLALDGRTSLEEALRATHDNDGTNAEAETGLVEKAA
jgi:hypothetical protein